MLEFAGLTILACIEYSNEILRLSLTYLRFDDFNIRLGNGGDSTSLTKVKFGTHDWIAFEGYKLAKQQTNVTFITRNLNAYFAGTEAPDRGVKAFSEIKVDISYHDTGCCHKVLFDAHGNVINDAAARRVREEFDKLKDALKNKQPRLAAFYAGTMAHYLGDLSQFMHLMDKDSHWGAEDQDIHHRFEEVIDKRLNIEKRTSTIYSSFIKERKIGPSTAQGVAIAVARFGNWRELKADHWLDVQAMVEGD